MATNIIGGWRSNISLEDQRTAVTGAAGEIGRVQIALQAGYDAVSGVAAGMIDKVWGDVRTVATGATDSLDLVGILTDAFGATVTFVKLRGIAIAAASTNTTNLTLSRPAANGVPLFGAASGALAPTGAGGYESWVDTNAGVNVTAGTGDLIAVTNSAGATAQYTIVLIGTSA